MNDTHLAAVLKQSEGLGNILNQLNVNIVNFRVEASQTFQTIGESVTTAHQQSEGFLTDFRTLLQGTSEALSSFGNSWNALLNNDYTTSFAQLQNSFLQIQVQSGLSASGLESFRVAAEQLSASSQYSTQQIANAGLELVKAGLSADEAKIALESVSTAATAQGESIEKTAQVMGQLIQSFGFSAAEASKVADIMQNSGLGIQEFGKAMETLGPLAHEMGQPMEDIATLLGVFNEQGIKSGEASKSIQGALQSLQDPKAIDALGKYGVNIKNADGSLKSFLDILLQLKPAMEKLPDGKQSQVLAQIFGGSAQNSLQSFFSIDQQNLDQSIQKFGDFHNEADKAASVMQDGLLYSINEFNASIKNAAAAIGENLAPTIQFLLEMSTKLVNFFLDLPEPIQSAISHIGLFGSVATATLVGSNGVSALVGQSGNAFSLFGGIVKDVLGVVGPTVAKMALKFGQFGLVAESVHIAYKTNFGGLKDILDDFMGWIGEVVGWLDDLMGGRITAWKDDWNKIWNDIGYTIKSAFSGAVDTLITFIGIMDKMSTAFLKMVGNLSRGVRGLMTGDLLGASAEAQNALNELSTMGDALRNLGDDTQIKRLREMARTKFFGAPKQEKDAPKDVVQTKGSAWNSGSGGSQSRISKALDIIIKELDKSVTDIRDRAKQRDTAITNAEAARPTGGSVSLPAGDVNKYPLTSKYSLERVNPVTGELKPHTGNDYGAPMGAPIRADFDGTVVFSGPRGGYGNTIVVSDGKGNYAVYAHASKLYKDVDVSVKRGEKIAAVGNTGKSTGPHFHREHRTSANPNLREDAVFSAVPQDPNKTGIFSRGAAVNIDEHAHGADFAQQRLLNQKQAIEQEYAKQAAALAKLKALRAQYSGEISNYSKEDQEALRALDEAIVKVQSKIRELENSAAYKNLDLSKAKAKAEQDEIKEQLKNAEDQYGNLDKASEKALSDLAEKVKELKAANEATFKSEEQLADEANQRIIAAAKASQATLQQQLAGIDAVLAKFKGKTLDEDNKKLIQGLQQRRAQVAKELAASASDLEEFNSQLTEAQNIKDFAEMVEEGMIILEENEKKFNDLLNNEDELRKFAYQIDLGSDSLEAMSDRLYLTTEETDKLRTALLKLNNQRATENLIEDEKEKSEEAKAKAEAAEKSLQNFRDTFGALRAVAGFFQSFSKEAESAFSIVAEGLADVGQGIVSIASGIKDSNPFAIISGSLQSMSGFLETGLKLMARMKSETVGLYHAQTEGGVIDAQNAAQSARDRVASLRANGGSALDIFNAANEATRSSLEEQRRTSMADFHKQYGRDRVIDKDAQGNDDIPAMIARYERAMLNPELSTQTKTGYQHIVNYLKRMNGELVRATNQAQQEFTNNLQEFVDKNMESGEKITSYWERLDNQAGAERITKEIISSALGGGSAAAMDENGGFGSLGEELRPMAEKLAADMQAIVADVNQAFELGTKEHSDELARRLGEWGRTASKTMADALIDAQTKAIETATAARDKALSEAQEQLKQDVEAAKEAQKAAYDSETRGLRESLKLDQERLDRMERQTREVERQIQLKNDDRKKDLEAFNAADKVAFAKMKSEVNYDTEIRNALDAIHNPDGVLTGTYSTESLREAAKEQIDLLKLRNQNAFDEEDKSEKDYLKRKEEIAALEARFAQEALSGTNLTTREQVDLERIKAQAYKDFQQARIDSINAGYDAEVAVLEKQIADNNRKAQSFRDNMDANNLKLETFNTQYEANIKALDDGMNALIASQDGIGLGLVALADGIGEPMAKISEKYQGLERKINNAYQAAMKLNAATGTTYSVPSTNYTPYSPAPLPYSPAPSTNYTPYSPAPLPSGTGTTDLSAFWVSKAKKMATGGLVPKGFPNDTYPALLSSGEAVLPVWFTQLLANAQRTLQPGGAIYDQSKRVQITLQGVFNEPGMVRREIMQALQQANYAGAGVNGTYYMNTGLN
ncbi:MAG: phage tail tape measure protein [Candidatus Sericytochromatia bacterium]